MRRVASMVFLVVVANICAGWGGCGPGGPSLPNQTDSCSQDAPPPGGNPVVMLGRDVEPFQRLADGDQLSIVHGPQGGQHVYVTLRLYSRTASTWAYAFDYVSPQGAPLANSAEPVSACAGWTTSKKVRVVLTSAAPATGTLTVTAKPVPADDAAPPVADHASVSVQ